MLHYAETIAREPVNAAPDAGSAVEFIDLDRIFAMLRRQIWVLATAMIIGLLVGSAYIMTAVPLYTATTDILIDKGQSKLVDELASASGVFQDEAEMLSQVELLKSDQISGGVIRELKLADDPNFLSGNPSFIRTLRSAVGALLSRVQTEVPPEINEVANKEQIAVGILQQNLTVQRVGQTYVLRLGYTSPDPKRAAEVARAYGNAYLDDQLQAKYEATRRASGWLQDRIAELKQQSYDADFAVQKFRNDNGLIESGEGALISQQQLSEITTQLISVEATTAQAKAQAEQIEGIIKSGRTDAVVNDALASQTINALRTKYLDAARRETEITGKLGPDHIQAVRLKAEMEEYERLIFGELGRIAESYRSTYLVALERQKSLESSLAKVKVVNAGDNTTQVRLRELERESATFKSLYDNFLQRYQQTVQQQSFPITDARIIKQATPPGGPSAPKKPLILALFLALGAAAGAGVAGLREFRERFFRVGNQVRTELDMEFLGYVPAVVPEAERGSKDTTAGLWRRESVATYVHQKPMSAFAETLRNIKVAADLGMPDLPSKVIGLVSCLPSEGKSSISSSLGNLLAMQGLRTLIIDGDIRNPGLTRALAKKPERGLIEVVIDQANPDDVLLWDASGNLAVLPTVLKGRVSNTSDLLASATVADMLAHFRKKFDYIIVDLPPIGPVVDAKAFASRVDAFVLVVEWGRTSRQLVRSTIGSSPVFRSKSLGVILNKANSNKMKLYRSYASAEYYASNYESYYKN